MSFNIDGAPAVETSKPGLFASNEPGALSLDEILQKVSQDDEEEWEYEYSTTETEVCQLWLAEPLMIMRTSFYADVCIF